MVYPHITLCRVLPSHIFPEQPGFFRSSFEAILDFFLHNWMNSWSLMKTPCYLASTLHRRWQTGVTCVMFAKRSFIVDSSQFCVWGENNKIWDHVCTWGQFKATPTYSNNNLKITFVVCSPNVSPWPWEYGIPLWRVERVGWDPGGISYWI